MSMEGSDNKRKTCIRVPWVRLVRGRGESCSSFIHTHLNLRWEEPKVFHNEYIKLTNIIFIQVGLSPWRPGKINK
jgi:hypothetical protein